MIDISHKANAVREFQSFLLELAYSGYAIEPIAVDGIYGPKTRAACLAFQKAENLKESGVGDYETWQKLFQCYTDARAKRSRGDGN